MLPKIGCLVQTQYGTGNVDDLLPTADRNVYVMIVKLHDGRWAHIEFDIFELTPITIH